MRQDRCFLFGLVRSDAVFVRKQAIELMLCDTLTYSRSDGRCHSISVHFWFNCFCALRVGFIRSSAWRRFRYVFEKILWQIWFVGHSVLCIQWYAVHHLIKMSSQSHKRFSIKFEIKTAPAMAKESNFNYFYGIPSNIFGQQTNCIICISAFCCTLTIVYDF